jgi:predicted DNA-binding transcriptional regulator AlpA
MNNANDRLIDEAEAAEILGIAKQTLSVWRCTGRYGLPFVKIGRLVRYRLRDLEQFISDRTLTNTGLAQQLDGDKSQAPSRRARSQGIRWWA